MISKAKTPEQYFEELPEDRKEPMKKLWTVIKKNLPKGFESGMGYGMVGFHIPHSLYPPGYHCDPRLPLPFIGIASQKNFIALYHMGIYADPKLLKWFTDAYKKSVPDKLDMGKSCIRFKKTDQIPFKLIGELAAKIKASEWIDMYENAFRKRGK